MKEAVIQLRNKILTFALGDTFVEDEVKVFREGICKDCPNFDPEKEICKICKCVIIDVKSTMKTNFNIKKGRFEITHCPEGKWNDKDVAEYFKNK